jgi:translocation and assembly module TamB
MSDSEAIAILITGKSLNSASRTEASILVDAITTLGLKKGESVTNQISQTFGLDVLTIDTETELDQSSLLIGKYLTPRIYVYYAIGLFDQASKLALDYQLSRRVKLEAISGKNQSMDIIYRIER